VVQEPPDWQNFWAALGNPALAWQPLRLIRVKSKARFVSGIYDSKYFVTAL